METKISIGFWFFQEDQHLLPPDALLPVISDVAHMPAVGDAVFISPRSAWQVTVREIQHLDPQLLQVKLWLQPAPELLGLKRLPALRPVPPAPPAAALPD